MSVKIIDNSQLLVSERTNKVSLALRLMIEAIYKNSIPITPKEHGNLRADVIRAVQGLHGSIKWDKNYAAAQEAGMTRGFVIRNYTTGGTGAHYAARTVKSVVSKVDTYLKQAGL